MAAYTYYTDEEIKHWHDQMQDTELKKLIEEVNAKTGRTYFARQFEHSTKRVFKKPLKHHRYSLYFKVSDGEVKCINFEPLTTCINASSLNYTVDRSYITTYLFGVLTGLKLINQVS